MNTGQIVLAVLGVAMLMVVHESGHYFAARYFGMRVTTFSIGIGPPLWKYQPPGSPTVFQIAIIPFMAYVKIAGINPFEDIDPDDKESYANASVKARIVTISAGSILNYLFATVLFFFGVLMTGKDETNPDNLIVDPTIDGPAYVSGIRDGDHVLSIDGKPVKTWASMRAEVEKKVGEKLDVLVTRNGEELHFFPETGSTGTHKGRIQMGPHAVIRKVTIGEAAIYSVTEPAAVVKGTLIGIGKMVTLREKPQFLAPHEVVGEVAGAVKAGPGYAFQMLGALSAYLGAFNLLPLPALDGGRLFFLLYELIARRKPDAKMEAKIHVVGILLFLTFTMVLTVSRIFNKH
jgi:regulator of sigma E protease